MAEYKILFIFCGLYSGVVLSSLLLLMRTKVTSIRLLQNESLEQ